MSELDAENSLRELTKIAARNPHTLTGKALASAAREIEELVPRGHYNGPAFGVRVVRVGYSPEIPAIADFFVEVQRLSDNKPERIPVALFLETYQALSTDLV